MRGRNFSVPKVRTCFKDRYLLGIGDEVQPYRNQNAKWSMNSGTGDKCNCTRASNFFSYSFINLKLAKAMLSRILTKK
jgi:hypothetical protein